MEMKKNTYEAPECQLMPFPQENAICNESLGDKAGQTMEEGDYWYEY